MLQQLHNAIAADPLTFTLCALAILAGGIGLGYLTRLSEARAWRPPQCAPMRTTNSSLVDLETRRALKAAGARPHARAGRSHLKPSYDSRRHDDAALQTTHEPRA